MKLLRVEGVNMRFVVQDTQDLKTISGGSQILLDAIHDLAEVPAFKGRLLPISLGASSGLFEVADRTITTEAVGKELRTLYPHATFVVDQVEGNDFTVDEEKVRAANRWRQMSHPSVAFPQAGAAACGKDRLRPASSTGLSPSVEARRARDKTTFYARFAERAGVKPCDDFNQLATDETMGNLDGKIAVIYADGNQFGKTISKHCTSKGALRSVDGAIQEKRRRLLGAVVDGAEKTKTGQLRLETLLWGGDELIWVVPAWRGWDTLQLFYEHARWALRPGHDDQAPTIVDVNEVATEPSDIPLHHAAGLVFCHRSAHIHRITTLASDLADLAKKDRTRSLFAYQVLESFDATGLNLEAFRNQRAPSGASMVLDGAEMSRVATAFKAYKATDPPRDRIHDLARVILGGARDIDAHLRALHDGPMSGPHGGSVADLAKRAQGEYQDMPALMASLQSVDIKPEHKEAVPWLHIAELWDYVEPRS